MKKVLFLCLLLPELAIGQDSLKIRQIMEKSAQTMDLKSRSITYKLIYTTSETGEKEIEYITAQTMLDSTYSIQKLFTESKIVTEEANTKPEQRFLIEFLDKTKDTSFRFSSFTNLLKVGKYNDLKRNELSRWNNYYFHYFRDMLIGLGDRTTTFDRKDTAYFLDSSSRITFLKDSSLSYKGIAHINHIPCHVIEHITINPSNFTSFGYRYPDLNSGYYHAHLYYDYYYIDTSSFIVQKSIFFGVTKEQDTVSFQETTLQSYSINPIKSLDFNTQKYPVKKILRLTSESPCSKDWIVQELIGKAPNLTGIDEAGIPFSLYQQNAQCYVLDFMFATCGVCIEDALPFWKEMQAKYNNPNIQYLVVDPVDKPEVIKRMVQINYIKTPVISDKNAAKNYAIPSYPTYYILDKDFKILLSGHGEITTCNKQDIEKILSSY